MNLNIGNDMNAEEKVKAYDEALERAKIHYETTDSVSDMELLELIFPNLRENEDERIRQRFIKLVKMSSEVGGFALHKWEADEMLAWLGKQGEQKGYTFKSIPRLLDMIEPTDRAKAYCQKLIDTLAKEGYNTDTKIVEEVLNGWNGENIPMAVMDEQKPINKIEPKFKVDDWVVDNNGKVAIIYDLQKAAYVGHYTDGTDFICKYNNEYLLHLWTIADAKDGDVLDANGAPFIYKKHSKDYVYFYCGVNLAGDFIEVNGIDTWDSNSKVHPATKKQRDLLFAKMKEAGYEWDAEKKELKKIEQKPTWSEDKKLTDVNHEYFSELLENNDSEDISDYAYQVAYCMSHDWIEETATWDDVQKACKLGAKWQEKHGSSKDWNEEDETNSYHLKTLLENLAKDIKHEFRVISDNDRDKYTAWLKSLKERVRPKQEWSEEDGCMLDTMEGWLDTLCEYLKDGSSEYIPDVESCINWLKSLKERIGG